MDEIIIKEKSKTSSGWQFVVGVKTKIFTVSVEEAYARKLAPGHDVDDLVRASFLFLLDNEPLNSIMTAFDLSVIKTYFPHFESAIGKYIV